MLFTKMKTLVERMFSLNLNVLRIFGFYSPKKYKLVYRLYSYSVFIVLVVPPPILAALYLLFEENIDLTLIAQNVFAITQIGTVLFKLLQFICSADKIEKCLGMIESQVYSTPKEQEHFMGDCVKVCTRNSKCFQILCFFVYVSWSIVPLFGTEYRLPLDVWLPYDVTSGGILYISSYIVLVTGVTIDTISTGAIDPLIGGLAYFAVTQLRILKHNLQNVTDDCKDQFLEHENLKSKIINNKLNHCIIHHKAILDFVGIYEDTFSSMVFIQFSTSVVVLCISCLQLSMVEPFTVSFFSMIIFINAVLTIILFYCYFGTLLFEESNSLTDAAYTSQWVDFTIKNRKTLIILMERCKRPLQVTAGKILDLSLDTFTTILKRSYSLLAVLKNY